LLFKVKPLIVHAWLGRSHRFAFFGKLFFKSKIIFSFRNTANKTDLYYKYLDFYFLTKYYVDLYISNSLIQIDYLQDLFSIKKHKNIFLANGYNVTANNVAVKNSDLNNDKIKVLLPSRICRQKNQLDLLQYLESNPTLLKFFHFHLVGPIYDMKYYNLITKKLNNNLLLNNCVTIVTKNIDINSEYKNADVILLNSLFEGFSNVILES
jgi:glycosyltransferase involved in cell wall biosynthesis